MGTILRGAMQIRTCYNLESRIFSNLIGDVMKQFGRDFRLSAHGMVMEVTFTHVSMPNQPTQLVLWVRRPYIHELYWACARVLQG